MPTITDAEQTLIDQYLDGQLPTEYVVNAAGEFIRDHPDYLFAPKSNEYNLIRYLINLLIKYKPGTNCVLSVSVREADIINQKLGEIKQPLVRVMIKHFVNESMYENYDTPFFIQNRDETLPDEAVDAIFMALKVKDGTETAKQKIDALKEKIKSGMAAYHHLLDNVIHYKVNSDNEKLFMSVVRVTYLGDQHLSGRVKPTVGNRALISMLQQSSNSLVRGFGRQADIMINHQDITRKQILKLIQSEA